MDFSLLQLKIVPMLFLCLVFSKLDTVIKTLNQNRPSLKELIVYFLKLGSFVFGGPVVLCDHMRRDLVENFKWISAQEYSEGFALSQLAPGPLATQLAIYIGWTRYRNLGATLIGFAFVLPSFLMVLVLAFLYTSFGGLPWIQSAFYGIGSAVIAIMILSSHKLATKTFKADKILWTIGVLSGIATVVTESENIFFFLIAGFIVVLSRRLPGLLLSSFIPGWMFIKFSFVSSKADLKDIFLFFVKAGAFVFGSGLAIVPFLHSGVVTEQHWLTEQQFLDAVAVAMITPGPVVITVAFIGYLISGPLGAVIAALGVFLPCFLFVVFPAPYFSRFAQNLTIKAFVDGVTSAAVGAIAGATVVLGKRALVDGPSIVLCVVALILLLKVKRVSEQILILFAGLIGYTLKMSGRF